MNRLDKFCKRGIVLLITITLAAVLASPTFAADTSCATKYPIILAHGMGFYPTDTLPDSFPGIKAALEECGATVYVTQVEPLGTSAEKGEQFINGYTWGVAETDPDYIAGYDYPETHFPGFNEIKATDGAKKFHIIGHSQGGLYTRWAITMGGIAQNVASLTTVDSPHLGSQIDDIQVQLGELMPKQADKLADAINPYNIEYIAKNSGKDVTPADVKIKLEENTADLTSENMADFNEDVPMPDPKTGHGLGPNDADVYYQSFSCAYKKYNVFKALQNQMQMLIDLNKDELPELPDPSDGLALAKFIKSSFPDYAAMSLLYGGGQGDGLVQVNDAKLGVFLGVEKGPRSNSDGLNHFDAVNIDNENNEKWDAISYYVGLVKDLKRLEIKENM